MIMIRAAITAAIAAFLAALLLPITAIAVMSCDRDQTSVAVSRPPPMGCRVTRKAGSAFSRRRSSTGPSRSRSTLWKTPLSPKHYASIRLDLDAPEREGG